MWVMCECVCVHNLLLSCVLSLHSPYSHLNQIQQVRVFVEAGNIRDGNYVAVLNSPQREINPYGKLELWHKFNFRQSNGQWAVQ